MAGALYQAPRHEVTAKDRVTVNSYLGHYTIIK